MSQIWCANDLSTTTTDRSPGSGDGRNAERDGLWLKNKYWRSSVSGMSLVPFECSLLGFSGFLHARIVRTKSLFRTRSSDRNLQFCGTFSTGLLNFLQNLPLCEISPLEPFEVSLVDCFSHGVLCNWVNGENCPISRRRGTRKILSRLWLSWLLRSWLMVSRTFLGHFQKEPGKEGWILVCQDAFDHDKGQKSAISGRRLH